jgi:small multidrug resistance pump
VPVIYALFGLAVSAGVLGSTMLKLSHGFRRWWPSVGTVVGYGVATVLMAVLMEHLPVGVVYAVWGGVTVLVLTVVGRVMFGERPTWRRLAGIALIVGGVVVLNLAGTM